MLKIEITNNFQIVSFDNINRFNALISEQVKEELNQILKKADTKMILNLAGVGYMDSSAFGVLLSILKTASSNYCFVKFCNISPELMELIKLLQLQSVFEIYPTIDDCINSFK